MGNMYKALEQVQKKGAKALAPRTGTPPQATARRISFPEKPLLNLYNNIESILKGQPKKVIQFIGSKDGEGVSTIVSNYGLMLADKLNKPTVIFDADQITPRQHAYFKINPVFGWDILLGGDEDNDECFYQVRDLTLYVCPVLPGSPVNRTILETSKAKAVWGKLKERFDYVLVDSPSEDASAVGIALAKTVDGVVLVLEAEKTRYPMAENTKNAIEQNGGRILGVVFNKRRQYIPDFIYSRL
ncbi:MAG: CpsD/CapB family tyrosine-protein kinase [Candidatus Magnetominusculus sp. LBB02]|nr:CpsD/CapB family tyrosine-protein kinase [Candidatus Magnetominusculus sp. LBB02]